MLRYIKLLTILFLVVCCGKISAQRNEIDSLVSIAKKSDIKTKIEIYSNVCWKLRNYDPQQALDYGKAALDYATSEKDSMNIVKLYSFVGVCYRNLGNYQDAFESYDRGLDLALKYNLKDQAAYAYINKGNLYLYHDEYDSAGKQLVKALDIGKEIEDSSILAYSYLNLGRVCLNLNQNETATSYLKQCLAIRKITEKEWDKIATVQKYLGDAAAADDKYEKALSYYLASISGNYDFKDYDLLSNLYTRISEVYIKLNQPDSALYYAYKGLETSQVQNINYRIKDANKAIGNAYRYQGDYKKSLEYYDVVMNYGDTFFNTWKQFGINNIQYKIDQVKKQNEIVILQKDKEIQNYYLLSMVLIILLVVITSIILSIKNRQTRKLNQTLQLQKDEISAKNTEITAQRDVLENQNVLLEKQKKEITDSIAYARRIQFSMLPDDELFMNYFSDYFVFYRPKSVVSGDFYWALKDKNYFVLMVADCTGHGVPGAFMSMLGFSLLNEIVGRDGCRKAGEIMQRMRDMIKKTLKQDINDPDSAHDGMDAALILVDKNTNILEYSGANIPFLLYRNNEEIIVKPVRNPVGIYVNEKPFEGKQIQLEKNDHIYLSSDGYQSQFGGSNNRILKTSGFRSILSEINTLPMGEQVIKLEEKFNNWKGKTNQTDDVMVIGLMV